ncbi:hypothetical protein AJ88_11680 [Mesorhizobium amorphae CCBAU 01583]|nr:hypothetical protein AJ88_11680 [Mesorhizobium amorphae CCBAU 01583]
MKWHDEQPFTAEDVKFTLELLVDPKFRSWRRAGHELVQDLTVVSPTEIKWKMKEPYAPYPSILAATFIVPKHVLGAAEDKNTAPFNNAPIGTGPFKWVERMAGDHIELAANTDYFADGPYLKSLIYKYIPDLTVLYTQFKTGDIDVIGLQWITADHYEEAKALSGTAVPSFPPPRSNRSASTWSARSSRNSPFVRRCTMRWTRRRSSTPSTTGCRPRPKPTCRSSPSTTIPICRSRNTIWTRQRNCWTTPAGFLAGTASVSRMVFASRSRTRPRRVIISANRRSSSFSNRIATSASRW